MTDNRPVAILVAHGQPSAPEPAEAALAKLAEKVQETLPDVHIISATLALPGRLEQVCESSGKTPVVFPCFMARGWFTNQVLPKRLEGYTSTMARPLGLLPDLPALVDTYVNEQSTQQGWSTTDTDILLAAHGSSRSQRAAQATYEFADALASINPALRVRVGFVEQHPSVKDAANKCGPQALCLPFFAQEGDHVRTDIVGALKQSDFQGKLLPAVGVLPGVPALIGQEITRALG